MSTVVAVANRKGGVGKTTSTVNLAYALHKQGHSVLVIDVDEQCSLSAALGLSENQLEQLHESGKTLMHCLLNGSNLSAHVVQGTPDLVASSDYLGNAKDMLMRKSDAQAILKKKIDGVRKKYDFILLDCPPERGFFTLSALTAADFVLIPVKTDYNSTRGVRLLFKTIVELRKKANPRLRPLGVLPVDFHARNKHDTEVLDWIREEAHTADVEVFPPVHSSTAFNKAAVEGKSTLELYPRTKGVQSYSTIASKLKRYGN